MSTIFSDLKESTVLVTGASRGIGKAIAESLAAQGAHVVFNYRGDEGQAEELKKHLIEWGAKDATALKFDVTNTDQMKEAVTAFAKDNPIHGLVNNAGISKDMLALRMKAEDINNILNTNLTSAMMLTSFLTRYFMKQDYAQVVNVSSIVGLMGNPGQAPYAASKAGLLGFTKSYAKEMASKNIRCNAICPGFIQTDMTDDLSDDVREQYFASIPLSRFGTVQEVATLTCFLLSRASSYITGEIIKIDGGLYI